MPFFHKRKGILKIDHSVKKCRDIGSVWELHAPTHWLLIVLSYIGWDCNKVAI